MEFLLLAADQFSFLLVPLASQALARFGRKRTGSPFGGSHSILPFCRQTNGSSSSGSAGPAAPAAAQMKQQPDRNSLAGLESELAEFFEWHQNELDTNQESRLALLGDAKRLLKDKWPWVSVRLALPVDPIDRQLNWMDHDLCLIADWDLPELAPRVPSLASAGSAPTSTGSATISDSSSSSSENSSTDDSSMLAAAAASQSSAEVAPPSSAPIWRPIYSKATNQRGRFLLEMTTTSAAAATLFATTSTDEARDGACQTSSKQTQQRAADWQQTRPADGHPKSLFLRVKWACSSAAGDEQLEEQLLRSRLLFYHTQRHPELAPLFLAASSLLEWAQLIEPAAVVDASQVGRWRNAATAVGSDQALDGGAGTDGLRNQLSRYELALMLAAYLESSSSPPAQSSRAQSKRHSRGDTSLPLAEHLIGFLSAFAPDAGERLVVRRPPPALSRRPLELELLAAAADDDECKLTKPAATQLVVFDPIGPATVTDSDNDDDDYEADSKELTKDLDQRTIDEVRGLFGRLAARLASVGDSEEANDTTTTANHPAGTHHRGACNSLMHCLFAISCERTRATVAAALEEEEEGGAKSSPPGTLEPPLAARLASSPSVAWEPERGQPHRRRRRLRPRKILTSLLYLALFLFVRNLLLNYLEHLGSSLQEQTRDDLVLLKQLILMLNEFDDSGFGDDEADDGGHWSADDQEEAEEEEPPDGPSGVNGGGSDIATDERPTDEENRKHGHRQEDEIIDTIDYDGGQAQVGSGANERGEAETTREQDARDQEAEAARFIQGLMGALLMDTLSNQGGGSGDYLAELMGDFDLDYEAEDEDDSSGTFDHVNIETLLTSLEMQAEGAGSDDDDVDKTGQE